MITVATENYQAHSAPTPFQACTRRIIAQPNQSASWQTNKQILIGIGMVSCLIATAFGAIGAWVILPFAGIEITALGSALYVVCRKLQRKHVLLFDGEVIVIEKGCRQAEQRWQLQKTSTAIMVERGDHPWDPLRLYLLSYSPSGEWLEIPVGEFLNKADSRLLLNILKQQGLPIRGDSRQSSIEL